MMEQVDKKFTFLKCRDRQFGFEWWAWRVKTPKEFVDFAEIRGEAMTKTYLDLKMPKVWSGTHVNAEGWMYHKILIAVKNRKTVVDDLEILSNKVLKSYADFWLKGEILLINTAFGFRLLRKDVEVLDTIAKDNNIFPCMTEKDIRIIHWKDGKHYYAKIGNKDVIDADGEQKWNTRKEARYWANKYFNE